jgi:LysR family transcriptional regulator, regulator for bpeEF and oprC
MPRRLDLDALDLNELRVFGAVGSRCSFVSAAKALGVPTATVSRKIKSLEEGLGVRLLQRTTRRVALTEVGAALLERWTRIEEDLAEAGALVDSFGDQPRGTLRVTAPFTMGREYLMPFLPEFLARFPELKVVLLLRNDPGDLIERGVDVAVWPWPVQVTGCATRIIFRGRPVLFAGPAYLERRGRPVRPEDLAGHDVLLYIGGPGPPRHEWTLRRGTGTITVKVTPLLACNDFAPLRAAAEAGTGIIMAGDFMIRDALRRRELVPILPGWEGPALEVRAVFPSRSGLAPKVRAFIDFLVERLGRLPVER